MELRIAEYQLPAPIEFNFDELRAEVAESTDIYKGIVYAPAEIKTAKADRAKLNKLRKAINDERIRQERAYLEPFQQFKAQCTELISMIDAAVANVDGQIKAFEAESKPAEPKKVWIRFEVNVSADEAKALNAYLKASKIEFRQAR